MSARREDGNSFPMAMDLAIIIARNVEQSQVVTMSEALSIGIGNTDLRSIAPDAVRRWKE